MMVLATSAHDYIAAINQPQRTIEPGQSGKASIISGSKRAPASADVTIVNRSTAAITRINAVQDPTWCL
jgi:hypothetical protein